jgi:GxxExxY protein
MSHDAGLRRDNLTHEVIGAFFDFLVEERLVLELKACAVVGELDRRQLLNYVRATGMPLGLLLQFGVDPQVLRVVNRFQG